MAARPTMRDVAAAAGVSLMTVSRVVNGEGGVAAETAARVERAVAELGYQRNDIARHLRQKNRVSRTIGLVVDDLANPFYSIMARAVEDEAYRRGFLVLLVGTHNGPRPGRGTVATFFPPPGGGRILGATLGDHPPACPPRTPPPRPVPETRR